MADKVPYPDMSGKNTTYMMTAFCKYCGYSQLVSIDRGVKVDLVRESGPKCPNCDCSRMTYGPGGGLPLSKEDQRG